IDTEADHRPAVVADGLDDVDLVATARPVLVLPQFSAFGMEREALRVAVAVAPDLGLGARPADERIVRRHRAVGPHAQDLAEMVAEILGLVAIGEMFARSEEEVVVGRLHDAAAEMVAVRERTLLPENHPDAVEAGGAAVDELRARERAACAAAR